MKTITSPKDRERYYALHLAGQSYAGIGQSEGVSAECVRLWCRRQKRGEGVSDRYYNPRAGVLSQFPAAVGEAILRLRRAHPHWGPASLRLHLQQDAAFVHQALPSRASIGRYLHSFAEFRRVPKKK